MAEIPEIKIRSVDVPRVPDYLMEPPQAIPSSVPVTVQIGFPVVDLPGCVESHETKNAKNNQINGLLTICTQLDELKELKLISKKDKNYVETELNKEAERTSKDKVLTFNNSLEALSKSDTTESDINDAKKTVQDIFAKAYLDKAGLVATFGGTGDPKTGENVYVKIGRYGPMAQIGEVSDEKKPRFASLLSDQSIQNISLEETLDLFKLPSD